METLSWKMVVSSSTEERRDTREKSFDSGQSRMTSRGRHLAIGLWHLGIYGEKLWMYQSILIIPIHLLVHVSPLNSDHMLKRCLSFGFLWYFSVEGYRISYANYNNPENISYKELTVLYYSKILWTGLIISFMK